MSDPPDSLLNPDAIREMLALAETTPKGCFVEVGVYRGGSAWHLARLARSRHRALHLFDTFTGIPERGPHDVQHGIGDFGDASEATVRAAIPDAVFHVGYFPNTMSGVPLLPVAFAHVDCDQYTGVKACIDCLWPIMPDGGVMLFDDYSCTSGCTKAVDEFPFAEPVRRTGQGKAYVVKGSH